MKKYFFVIAGTLFFLSCAKKDKEIVSASSAFQTKPPLAFFFSSLNVDNQSGKLSYYHISLNPVFKLYFSKKLDTTSVAANVQLKQSSTIVPVNISYQNNDSVIILTAKTKLTYLTLYTLNINTNLLSANSIALGSTYQLNQVTTIDSTDKFPRISKNKLLNLIEKKTFNYFWLYGHPTSGMARERYSQGDVVTTGGTGFGIMAIPAAINRNFITRADGLARVAKIVSFLDLYATKYHGAFAHWMNGGSGATIPFSQTDDGADIVETSYLMEGLLTARQYFNGTDSSETSLRTTINKLYQNVDWTWFTNGGQNTLYWHWSPDYGWSTLQQVNGWNEALITYIMAASSPTHPISAAVYANGWAQNGGIKNGNSYYGIQLPLGPAYGGPMFFSHYSFLGVNPNGLTDTYGNYQTQTINHSLINYTYCVTNPQNFNGYSDSCWGLTASDIQNGYNASSPTSDVGVIAPTAAISSLPYSPAQSLAALEFFYYKLGDKLWGIYGFYDAFNLSNPWFDNDYLAIDQGPIIVMIENYRSQLLWNLFTGCPEIKTGMKNLGFSAPYL